METSPFWKISCFALVVLILVACASPTWAAEKKAPTPATTALKVHPLVFSLIQGWLSDGESPVVTEINLDATEASRNQFDPESIKQEDGWTRCSRTEGGFSRYRVVKSKAEQFTVEYQENGGGSLTLAATIECSIGKRTVEVDGKAQSIRVLRVLSYRTK